MIPSRVPTVTDVPGSFNFGKERNGLNRFSGGAPTPVLNRASVQQQAGITGIQRYSTSNTPSLSSFYGTGNPNSTSMPGNDQSTGCVRCSVIEETLKIRKMQSQRADRELQELLEHNIIPLDVKGIEDMEEIIGPFSYVQSLKISEVKIQEKEAKRQGLDQNNGANKNNVTTDPIMNPPTLNPSSVSQPEPLSTSDVHPAATVPSVKGNMKRILPEPIILPQAMETMKTMDKNDTTPRTRARTTLSNLVGEPGSPLYDNRKNSNPFRMSTFSKRSDQSETKTVDTDLTKSSDTFFFEGGGSMQILPEDAGSTAARSVERKNKKVKSKSKGSEKSRGSDKKNSKGFSKSKISSQGTVEYDEILQHSELNNTMNITKKEKVENNDKILTNIEKIARSSNNSSKSKSKGSKTSKSEKKRKK